MPTSSRLIVLQGDKERHIHWVGGQPGGVDCGEFAVGEAACGQLYPFLFIWKGQLSSILCCQDCWLVGYISIEDAVRSQLLCIGPRIALHQTRLFVPSHTFCEMRKKLLKDAKSAELGAIL